MGCASEKMRELECFNHVNIGNAVAEIELQIQGIVESSLTKIMLNGLPPELFSVNDEQAQLSSP